MITTSEAITDPVAFLQADPSIMAGHEELGQGQVIAAPDFDVIIEPSIIRGDLNTPTSRTCCPFLGNLYMKTIAHTDLPNGNRYMLRWYTSSQALNALSEDMGRTPGVDAFKFETVPYDEIPDEPYLGYLALGILPQAGGIDMFDHDRANHASGNVLLPRGVVRRSIQLGAGGNEQIVGRFDDMSAVYNDILQNYTSGDTIDTVSLASGEFTRNRQDIAGLRTFWATENSPRKRRDFMAAVGERIVGHLQEVQPLLHRLQADRRQQV